MGAIGELKRVEGRLIKELTEGEASLTKLADKYGVTRQAISLFAIRRGIKRSKTEHTDRCPICQRLLRIARDPQGDLISRQTIYERLKLGRSEVSYHITLLRKKGLVSRKFGRIRSRRVESALQAYFQPEAPVANTARGWGIRQLYRIVRRYKDLGRYDDRAVEGGSDGASASLLRGTG